jgi:hypothetical protein
MAYTAVCIRTVRDTYVAVGWSGHRTLTVDPRCMGLGFNGGELL